MCIECTSVIYDEFIRINLYDQDIMCLCFSISFRVTPRLLIAMRGCNSEHILTRKPYITMEKNHEGDLLLKEYEPVNSPSNTVINSSRERIKITLRRKNI